MRGTYVQRDSNSNIINELPVAIKTLNINDETESEQNAKNEIIKEAERMQLLNHKNIIKFVGMCNNAKSSCMIVLELAKLGPLHKYLRSHRDMKMFKIIRIMYQVSCAMQYIASKNLVHRDLAARNVLLCTEDLAKISDFGMTRKMNENLYYLSRTQGEYFDWIHC
jgi:serine/threonine protein kinase